MNIPRPGRISAGNGSVLVEHPTEALKEGLCWFRRTPDGDGQYEYLYSYDSTRDVLVTMPGFVQRAMALCPKHGLRDERVPLPDPDMRSAMEGVDAVYAPVLERAIRTGGGVVSVPNIIGFAATARAILSAFPRDGLVDRGTPVSLVAVEGHASAKRTVALLRHTMPGREIGLAPRTDSDDIIVGTYRSLAETPRHCVGLFVCQGLPSYDKSVVEAISSIRGAARWCVCSSPWGGAHGGLDLVSEGLFGPESASISYDDVVKAGMATPVTVCWLECPRPNAPEVSAPLDVLSAMCMQDNPRFVTAVHDMVHGVSGDVGCILTGASPTLRRLASTMPEVAYVRGKMSAARRNAAMEDIAAGTVRKAILDGFFPMTSSHGVMILADCGGADAVQWFPSKRLARRWDRTYIVDFLHKWDIHNGRHGRLYLNDEARERRYAEMGFAQVSIGGVSKLPFL